MNKKVIIMRGLPGSGKSHYIKEQFKDKNFVYCSADEFFTNFGIYKFDPKKLGEAHQACMKDFLNNIGVGREQIIVDNTNSRKWEYENYIEIARRFDYEVEVVEMYCPDKETLKKFIKRQQQHNVPIEKILEMWFRWEEDITSTRIKG